MVKIFLISNVFGLWNILPIGNCDKGSTFRKQCSYVFWKLHNGLLEILDKAASP